MNKLLSLQELYNDSSEDGVFNDVIEDNFSFSIICPNNEVGCKQTFNTIKREFPNKDALVFRPNSDGDFSRIDKEFSPKITDNNWSDLINQAIESSRRDWVFLLFSGSYFRSYNFFKYSHFVKSEKDVLYVINNKRLYFYNNSFNGLLVNKNFYKETGGIAPEKDFDYCKLVWSNSVISSGGVFKGLVGVNLN